MLKKEYVEVINRRIAQILDELDYHEAVIRDDIFKLLRMKGRVIFYPLEEEPDLDGFHVERYVGDELAAFVYINSAKNFEKCIFCAAHELGHIYEIEKDIEKIYAEAHFTNGQIDEIMNRFAAELLMPRTVFVKKLTEFLYADRKTLQGLTYGELMKIIVTLMDYFYVPYKAVVWRMEEVGFMKESGRIKFEEIERADPKIIDSYIYEGKFTRLRHPTYIKSFENLPEYLTRAEEEHLIGRNKIEQMRRDFSISLVASSKELQESKALELEDAEFSKEFTDENSGKECSCH